MKVILINLKICISPMLALEPILEILMIKLINQSAFLELPVDPEGAFYCFPSYHFDIGSVELSTRLLEEYHVATVPGLAFGDCGEGYLRLSYATSAKEIEDAMSRMETFFQDLDKNGT